MGNLVGNQPKLSKTQLVRPSSLCVNKRLCVTFNPNRGFSEQHRLVEGYVLVFLKVGAHK